MWKFAKNGIIGGQLQTKEPDRKKKFALFSFQRYIAPFSPPSENVRIFGQIYHQSIDALDKRVKRRKLDRDIADLAKALAKDLRSAAIADPEYANGDYPKDMQPDALIAAVTKQQYE